MSIRVSHQFLHCHQKLRFPFSFGVVIADKLCSVKKQTLLTGESPRKIKKKKKRSPACYQNNNNEEMGKEKK